MCDATAKLPVIQPAAHGAEHMELSVLTFNVEGLPWPARSHRNAKLDRIGTTLARLRASGQAPDVVLLQETFSSRAAAIARRSGYRNIVFGPGARDHRQGMRASLPDDFVAARSFTKGERFPKLVGSGLVILSDYPVTAVMSMPFSRHACAGFDCLSNKGAMLVRVAIPGVPTPVDVFTTHMNSQGASGVGLARSHEAHRFQIDENAQFLRQARDARDPLIFGGDFNMRFAPDLLAYFLAREPFALVEKHCSVAANFCKTSGSATSLSSWLKTQDLQGFDNGDLVTLRPTAVTAMFDRASGTRLSDHDGYEVTYRLSWTPARDRKPRRRQVAASGTPSPAAGPAEAGLIPTVPAAQLRKCPLLT